MQLHVRYNCTHLLPTFSPKAQASHYELQESFTDLALPFNTDTDEAVDLADMVRDFFQRETLSGANRYSCPNCAALRDATKVRAIPRDEGDA